MAKLIKAKHDVYGVVEVPETYLDKWPNDYTAITEIQARKAAAADRRAALDEKTVAELDAELESRGLPTDGVKADKVDRLLGE